MMLDCNISDLKKCITLHQRLPVTLSKQFFSFFKQFVKCRITYFEFQFFLMYLSFMNLGTKVKEAREVLEWTNTRKIVIDIFYKCMFPLYRKFYNGFVNLYFMGLKNIQYKCIQKQLYPK